MKIERGPDPGPFARHTDYKPFLRPLFRCRCAYCLTPDSRLGGEDGMTVDHFRPQAKSPDLRHAWTNLYYACGICNSHYKKDYPRPDEERSGKRFVDPCAEDPDDHFRLTRDPECGDYCRVRPISEIARYTVFRLQLNRRKSLRDFWREIDRLGRNAQRRMEEIRQNLALCAGLCDRPEIAAEAWAIRRDFETQLAVEETTLGEIEGMRPFPIDADA